MFVIGRENIVINILKMAEECDSEGVTDSPKKGPTLSTSTSSFEALDPHDPNLSKLATTMFQKTADYLFGELTATQLASVLVVCVAAGAQAQLTAWPYGLPSHLLPTAPVMTIKEPVVVKSVVPNIYPYPHVVQVTIPNQDTSRGLPQPVDDTPEVKSAKALFAKEYEKAAIAAALTPEMPVHPIHAMMPEIHRRRRDLTMRSPMHLQMPVNPYMNHYNWMTGQHMMTTPHIYYV